MVCATPEGIGAAATRKFEARSGFRSCAQRPKASERRRPRAAVRSSTPCRECSTPEGIGAAATGIGFLGLLAILLCSTPEGIGAAATKTSWRSSKKFKRAQRPKASERRRPTRRSRRSHAAVPLCSTPEGIGAAATIRRVLPQRGCRFRVLNARRHRSGGDPGSA